MRVDALYVEALHGDTNPSITQGKGKTCRPPAALAPSSTYLGGGDGADLLGRQAFQQRGLPRVVQPQQDNAELLLRGTLQPLDDGEQPLGARGAGGALQGAGSLQSTVISERGAGRAVGHGYPVSMG